MIENLPDFICTVLIATTFLALLLFHLSVTRSGIEHAKFKGRLIALFILVWLIVQAFLSFNGFYTDTSGVPPKFMLAVMPPLLIMLAIFLTYEGRLFIDNM